MSQAAVELGEALAATVERVGPSVVRVDARCRRPSSGVVFSSDGTIVTAAHAVERDEDIQVSLPDGTTLPATLVGRDHGTDLAVLRIAANGLPVAPWAVLDGVRVGHVVLAISRPGRTARAAWGIVGALGSEPWRTPEGGKLERFLQPDIDLQPGFSGSVLASAAGAALGINTVGLLRGTPTTIPVATIARVTEALLAHGHVRRGFLGIGAQPVRLSPALAKLASQEVGLLLVSIAPGSAAESAGLVQGDVLVSFGGKAIASVHDLLDFLDEERIGKPATATVLRGGQLAAFEVTVEAWSDEPHAS
ncbi:trypsin-like peptidase domain-containing protein [bacterium]|nr:trypsin-like peptidase domain-containing protein [bacterium]